MAWDYSIEIDENTFSLGWYMVVYSSLCLELVYTWYITSKILIGVPDVLKGECGKEI
jgi:hypothetical protein